MSKAVWSGDRANVVSGESSMKSIRFAIQILTSRFQGGNHNLVSICSRSQNFRKIDVKASLIHEEYERLSNDASFHVPG